jgi:hypothetical protein
VPSEKKAAQSYAQEKVREKDSAIIAIGIIQEAKTVYHKTSGINLQNELANNASTKIEEFIPYYTSTIFFNAKVFHDPSGPTYIYITSKDHDEEELVRTVLQKVEVHGTFCRGY